MIITQQNMPKICYTACGHLVVKGKILLVKHKKLQSWLSPGGHIEPNELPHQAAEREYFEETGLKVEAFSPYLFLKNVKDTERLPNPFTINLHWISRENFQSRQEAEKSGEKEYLKHGAWQNGCEQHLGFAYLMKPVGDLNFYENIEETDGIAWFSKVELRKIEILENIRQEIEAVFDFLD